MDFCSDSVGCYHRGVGMTKDHPLLVGNPVSPSDVRGWGSNSSHTRCVCNTVYGWIRQAWSTRYRATTPMEE